MVNFFGKAEKPQTSTQETVRRKANNCKLNLFRRLPQKSIWIFQGEPYKVKIIKQPKRDPNQVLYHRKSVQFEPVVVRNLLHNNNNTLKFKCTCIITDWSRNIPWHFHRRLHWLTGNIWQGNGRRIFSLHRRSGGSGCGRRTRQPSRRTT